MNIHRIGAAVAITGTLVIGAAGPAFARHGADDPTGHVRQEHRHGQVEVEHRGSDG